MDVEELLYQMTKVKEAAEELWRESSGNTAIEASLRGNVAGITLCLAIVEAWRVDEGAPDEERGE